MRILSVFGTRPEAIKMAPIVMALRAMPGVESRVCVTGQHRRMLDDTLAIFDIKPDDDLDIMTGNQTLADISARVLTGLDPIMRAYRPDFVLVQGDTATSTAAALTAFFNKVRVGHVEAGLRTGNLLSPWPEEANRRVTAVVTDRHYAPTEKARRALLAEGYPASSIMVTGNTVIDALLHVADEVSAPGPIRDKLDGRFDWIDPAKRMILVTGHRRESFGDGFLGICEALRQLAAREDVQIVYPVHLNPNVRQPVFDLLASVPNVSLIEPQDYRSFVYLMTRASLILTDSGGVQEEAPALGKPVLVMRDTSERMEAVEAGVARLVSTDPARIVGHVADLLGDRRRYAAMATGANPFGDGKAAARIVADLLGQSGVSPLPIPAVEMGQLALAIG
ncbi:UDP-N-acetylglucosamine 2-epimerase [Alsobacter metallidurans]|uniref:UDP-N-acetylglucosamine 2-epimerase (non-hydrolyzing) n=1 Tax=Alsobacter metallidurans TaxID=340221 RepID=A0A917MG81_9HYPH|nr:UDP-N-acetylglucosamine 2-epimerase (non-hydrolyzing) [Alsobacter metallidurans]GGH09411.1 UDP-N-acetylglucosamine 2-epimerase [Alsobacter metallidurans]